jgi:hypothetical protein
LGLTLSVVRAASNTNDLLNRGLHTLTPLVSTVRKIFFAVFSIQHGFCNECLVVKSIVLKGIVQPAP